MKSFIPVALIGLVFSAGVPQAFAQGSVAGYEQAREAYYAKRAADGKGRKGFSESDKQIMKQAAADLVRKLPEPGIKVGDKAPDFALNNAFGVPIRLSDELKQGPVVLVFYRGAWCPFCNMHLHVLYQNLPAIKRAGGRLVLVTPQQPDKSREQLKEKGYPFEVLSDLDDKVMKLYNLYFELDPELITVYKKFGLDIEAYNGKGRNVLPVPGSFVIDTLGYVRAMHADTDYKERMEPSAIIATLKQINRANINRGQTTVFE